ncbi:MAG: pyruvate kinase [Atopobiaceae bacterium]|nr:pyruvate kinase [Atopobiaceae bacterium]
MSTGEIAEKPVSNRTKIICTMGPSTEDDEVLAQMLQAGMNVARLNFSHGDHEYHRRNIERVRRIAKELGRSVAVLADTRGPEIRCGLNRNHETVTLPTGDSVTLTTRDVEGTSEVLHISYGGLPAAVTEGTRIFINDGLIELVVESTTATDINCRIVNGGRIGERKGINVPNVKTSMPAITEQDRLDIQFACEMKVDAIAASFVCDANAVRKIKELCRRFGAPDTPVFAKIEAALSITNFESILDAADGIMVARGDLGIEIPPAEVPYAQKKIIEKCNQMYKPVITATQMLESMVHNPRPTRAEVTDVASAISDGTDCVMLSGETAAGDFPVAAVRMMAEVCKQVERHLPERHTYYAPQDLSNVGSATSFAAVETAQRVGAVAILCPTQTGRTARTMCVFRPQQPIIATTPSERTATRTNFYWGVVGIVAPEEATLAATCYGALQAARDAELVQTDDIVVITAGDPLLSPLSGAAYEVPTNVCMVAQAV